MTDDREWDEQIDRRRNLADAIRQAGPDRADQPQRDEFEAMEAERSGLPGVPGSLLDAVEAGFEGVGSDFAAQRQAEAQAQQERIRTQQELMPDLDHSHPVIDRASEEKSRPSYSPSIPIEEGPTQEEYEADIWAGRR